LIDSKHSIRNIALNTILTICSMKKPRFPERRYSGTWVQPRDHFPWQRCRHGIIAGRISFKM